jgi:hypothetical protein
MLRSVPPADNFERALLDRHGEKGRQEIRGLLDQFKVELAQVYYTASRIDGTC